MIGYLVTISAPVVGWLVYKKWDVIMDYVFKEIPLQEILPNAEEIDETEHEEQFEEDEVEENDQEKPAVGNANDARDSAEGIIEAFFETKKLHRNAVAVEKKEGKRLHPEVEKILMAEKQKREEEFKAKLKLDIDVATGRIFKKRTSIKQTKETVSIGKAKFSSERFSGRDKFEVKKGNRLPAMVSVFDPVPVQNEAVDLDEVSASQTVGVTEEKPKENVEKTQDLDDDANLHEKVIGHKLQGQVVSSNPVQQTKHKKSKKSNADNDEKSNQTSQTGDLKDEPKLNGSFD